MKPVSDRASAGQAIVEYALLAALVALVVLGILLLLGPALSDVFGDVVAALSGAEETSSIQALAQDFMARILAFQQATGAWPRSWGDQRFTDLGLDPADWAGPVEGIYWNPNGDKVGLANRPGDNLQIYVQDLDGNRKQLYDGWNVWCVAASGQCYYHTVAPGNEVDIRTLVVVEE